MFDNDTLFVSFFEECGVSRHSASSFVCYIKILCTAVSGTFSKTAMIYRACFRDFNHVFSFCFNGAAEFDPVSIAFTPCATKDHFKPCIAEWCTVRAEYFGFLCVSWIERDEGFTFQVVNDEIIDIPFIISRISDEESASFEFVETFELFYERFGNLRIGSVIGKSGLNERSALYGSDNMSSVAPEEFKRFCSVCLFLIAVIMQGSL